MKKQNDLKFPYPFLQEDGGDYLNSKFNVDFNMAQHNGRLELECTYEIKCPLIEKLIDNGDAIVAIHLEQRTLRNVWPFIKGKKITINLDNLSPNHNIELVAMVVSKHDLTIKYDSTIKKSFSYFEKPFVCGKSSILGFSNFVEFELPTENKVSSIFSISAYKSKEDIDGNQPFKISLDGNVIDIKVMPEIKENFIKLRTSQRSHNKLLNSVFVYPAVQLAIMEIFKNYEAYKDYKWCVAIVNKIQNAKKASFESIRGNQTSIDKDDLIEFTHIILEDLITSSFSDLFASEEE